MAGIMQRIMMLIAATSSILFQMAEYAGHDLVAYGVVQVGYMSVWSIGHHVVVPIARGFPKYQNRLLYQPFTSSRGKTVDDRDFPGLPVAESADAVEPDGLDGTQASSASFWIAHSFKTPPTGGKSRKTAFVRGGARSGARIAQVLPSSAIGREVPVSSKRNKKSASPSKTVASGAGLQDGTVDIGQEGEATTNEFLIEPRMGSGEPTAGGGDVFAVELYKVGVDEGIEWESDGGVSMYTPLADGGAPPPSLRLESCGRDIRFNAKNLTDVDCHGDGTTGPVPVTENAHLSGYYIGSYEASTAGRYKTSVTQLLPGGLEAKFWPNGWLQGTPIVRRVDPEIAFNWGLNPVVPFSESPISARWEGKLLAPLSEKYTILIKAHGGIRLFLDHRLVIDAWEDNLRATKQRRALVDLAEDQYHDIVLEYREEGGSASVQLMWASRSIPPSVIPSWAFFYATPITGSPFDVTVSPLIEASPLPDTYEKDLDMMLTEGGNRSSQPSKEERRQKLDRDKETHTVTDVALQYEPIRDPKAPDPGEDQVGTTGSNDGSYVKCHASSETNIGFSPWYVADAPREDGLEVAREAEVRGMLDSDNIAALSVSTGATDFSVAASDMPLVVSSAPPSCAWAEQACAVEALCCSYGLSNLPPGTLHRRSDYGAPTSVEGCFLVPRDHHFAFPNDGNGVDIDALCVSLSEMHGWRGTAEDSLTSVAALPVPTRTPEIYVAISDMALAVCTASPDKGWPGQSHVGEYRDRAVFYQVSNSVSLRGFHMAPPVSSGACLRGSYGYMLTFPADGNIVAVRAFWLCLSGIRHWTDPSEDGIQDVVTGVLAEPLELSMLNGILIFLLRAPHGMCKLETDEPHLAEAMVPAAYLEDGTSARSTGAILGSDAYRVQYTLSGTYYMQSYGRNTHAVNLGTRFQRRVVGATDVDIPSTLEVNGFSTHKGGARDSTSVVPYSAVESSSVPDHPLLTTTPGPGVAADFNSNPTHRGSSTDTHDDVDLVTLVEVPDAPVDVAMEKSDHRLTPSPNPSQDGKSLLDTPLAMEQDDGWEVETPGSYEPGTESAVLTTEAIDESLSSPDRISTAPAQDMATDTTSGNLIASDTPAVVIAATWAMSAAVGVGMVCVVVAFLTAKGARRNQPEIDLPAGGEQEVTASPPLLEPPSPPRGPSPSPPASSSTTKLVQEVNSGALVREASFPQQAAPDSPRSLEPPSSPRGLSPPRPPPSPPATKRADKDMSAALVPAPSVHQPPAPASPRSLEPPSQPVGPLPSPPPSPLTSKLGEKANSGAFGPESSLPPQAASTRPPSLELTSPPRGRSPPRPSSPRTVKLVVKVNSGALVQEPSVPPNAAPASPPSLEPPSALCGPLLSPPPSSPTATLVESVNGGALVPEVSFPQQAASGSPPSSEPPSPPRGPSPPPPPPPPPSPPSGKLAEKVNGSSLVPAASFPQQAAAVTRSSLGTSSRTHPPLLPPPPLCPPAATVVTKVYSTVILGAATEETSKKTCRSQKSRKDKAAPSAEEIAAAEAEKAKLKLNRDEKRQAREGKRRAREAAKMLWTTNTSKAGSTKPTSPARPNGSLQPTPGLQTGSASVKPTHDDPNCPGPSPSSTPIDSADNMTRSGCGVSLGAAKGTVRGSGVPGHNNSRAAVSATSLAAGVPKQAALPTPKAAVSSNANAARVQSPRRTGKSALDWTCPENPPSHTGLTNKLNRCAINVAFQVFRHDFVLRQALMGVGGESPTAGTLGALMGKTFTAMEKPGGKGFVHPTVMTNICEFFQLTANGQLDAGEVIMYLLDKLHDDAEKAGDTFVTAAVDGMNGDTHYLCVCKCGTKSRPSDPFSLLPVPMEKLSSDGGTSGDGGVPVLLKGLLDKVFAMQTVETCETCRLRGNSAPDGRSRSPVLVRSPDRLMLQLGRFSGDDKGERQKLNYLVTVPKVLNVGPYTEEGKGSGGEVIMYDLDAVVHHASRNHQAGDVEHQRGHYTVCTRTGADTWCRYDDDKFSIVKTPEVLTKDAYLLSYHKRL